MSGLTLQQIARALGGKVYGDHVLAPGPGHSAKDRSLSIKLTPDGGFILNSHAGNDWKACKDYVRQKVGCPAWDDHPRPDYDPLRAMAERVRAHLRWLEEKAGEEARKRRALAIWNKAQHPRGTLIEAYFAHRRLTLPDEAAGEAIRFHPACPFGQARVPAMVSLVRDVVTDEPKAIHRTALDTEGRKVWVNGNDRLSLGPVSGGAVKLTPDEEVTLCLGIGEGIESTLSLRLAREFGPSPIWSLLSAGQVKALPALAGIETLWIAVDHDDKGVAAANAAARTWHQAGREVFLIKPHAAGTDLNDIAKRHNSDASYR